MGKSSVRGNVCRGYWPLCSSAGTVLSLCHNIKSLPLTCSIDCYTTHCNNSGPWSGEQLLVCPFGNKQYLAHFIRSFSWLLQPPIATRNKRQHVGHKNTHLFKNKGCCWQLLLGIILLINQYIVKSMRCPKIIISRSPSKPSVTSLNCLFCLITFQNPNIL